MRSEGLKGRGAALKRSWSWGSVLSGLRPGSSGLDGGSGSGMKRRDSGYNSGKRHDHFDNQNNMDLEHEKISPIFGNTILLEFSNYAHVELSRHGTSTTKRYEYEYWSTKYQWRREYRKEGDLRTISYHLVNMRNGRTIAHLVPEILTPLEAVEEEGKGGWVPPCSLWISDADVYERMPDVAE